MERIHTRKNKWLPEITFLSRNSVLWDPVNREPSPVSFGWISGSKMTEKAGVTA